MKKRRLKPQPNQEFNCEPFIKPKVQTKLAIGKSDDDAYELETDKVAVQVAKKNGNNENVKIKNEEAPVQIEVEEESVQTKKT